ncbi:hypothetical protein [Salmonella phage NINP13076]|uniref:DUF7736 domain-containing protein n=1 Tax=Salmonella phage SalP219 TaxID=3158864 RepID=A0AAU7PHY9_9CAUD|nr:hypothetical protein [Salmonella phage NINP13076]
MTRLTKEQAIIITAFTGFTACDFSIFHEDLEKRLGRPVWTHELANKEFASQVKDLYKDDFLKICFMEEDE